MNTKLQNKQTTHKLKGGKKIMTFLGIIIATMAAFVLVGTILRATYFTKKLEQITPYGQMVNVKDGQMHVYSMGNGEKTIVLFPGSGIALPSADFGPLMRKLSEKYTVVSVEYFGMGFSSETSTPRTSENYVEEIRIALNQGGFHSPYILMAHSISSVFSEYYAAKYPEEVEAIISLDGTSTAVYVDVPANFESLLQVGKFQQKTGISTILGSLLTNKKDLLSKGYTEKELNDIVAFSGFSLNDTVIEEIVNSPQFVKQTMEMPYPESVPYFKIISKKTYMTPIPQLNISPVDYQQKHLARIGESAKYEILEGSHFIYINNVDRIAEITDEFLMGVNH